MRFSLWDTETSNQFGQYEDEREVLTLVRTLVRHYGKAYAEDLSLGRIDESGRVLDALSGPSLLARMDEILGNADQGGNAAAGGRLAAIGRGVAMN